MPLKLGIDIGGTFTDVVLLDDETGDVRVGKTLTIPRDPAEGVLRGLIELTERVGISPRDLGHVIHATTLITNAIIERKGARTGLITTAGFRDLLEIGREARYDLYDLFLRLPEPLVPRALRLEVRERVGSDGAIVESLDPDNLRVAAERLAEAGVESIAVTFLHAYANDEHEREAARVIESALPGISVSVSSQVAREIREYERLSTTVVNAYVRPLADHYLLGLQSDLRRVGFAGPLHIMLSNGGVASVETARELPVRLVESGPAAGALIAGYHGLRADEPNVLAFDMGGTTAKMCLVHDGEPTLAAGIEVARVHRFKRGSGLPLRTPSVELVEIGAGGGSIARVDELGLLTVGPESAAADPGPACYGFGGDQPTVTDADLVLGYLNPAYFLGGSMRLDVAAADEAIGRRLGAALGLGVVPIAWGIHDIVNENMATAASLAIAEAGHDPRRYTLVATGGAGPLHAVEVARKIGLRRVLVPPAAGVASAAGLLVARPRMDLAQSYLTRLEEIDWARVRAIYAAMEQQARATVLATGVDEDDVRLTRMVDMRYANQGHEVAVTLPDAPLAPETESEFIQRFESVYKGLFGRTNPGVAIEAVTWRLTASGPAPRLGHGANERDTAGLDRAARPTFERPVYFHGAGTHEPVPVYSRYALQAGERRDGPAVIEERESTIIIGPRDHFEVDDRLNVVIDVGPT